MKRAFPCLISRAVVAWASVVMVVGVASLRADDMTPMDHARSLSVAFRKAALAVKPSVVTINTSYRLEDPSPQGTDATSGDPAEPGVPPGRSGRPRNPGGRPFPREEGENDDLGRPTSIGSGLIFADDGVVLTNNHVVQDAYKVIVRLSDGSEYTADNIVTDPLSDLAVLRIHPEHKLPTAAIGDSSQLEIGDWVIAIGSPFDLEATVSAGIISAKGRSMPLIPRSRLLQTDAAINPGNSGGPLVNLNGEVIGINTAIATHTGAFQGVGFAVPVEQAKWIAKELLEHGKVRRAYLGVSVGPLTADAARRMNLPARSGAWVQREPSSEAPAGKAGVKYNDVVVEFAKLQIRSDDDLREIVEKLPIGSEHTLVVMRDGERISLNIAVAALPDDLQPVPSERRRNNEKKKQRE